MICGVHCILQISFFPKKTVDIKRILVPICIYKNFIIVTCINSGMLRWAISSRSLTGTKMASSRGKSCRRHWRSAKWGSWRSTWMKLWRRQTGTATGSSPLTISSKPADSSPNEVARHLLSTLHQRLWS